MKTRFVVQANCTGMGWCNSQYGGDTLESTKNLELILRLDNSAWMPGKRETRILDNQTGTILPTQELAYKVQP